MSEDEMTLAMSVPLDSDGFLRRECPTCEKEFKWFPSDEESPHYVQPQDGGYFCPYCGIQASDGWLTKAQAELAGNLVAREAMGPLMDDFKRDIDKLNRGSKGLLSMSVEYQPPEEMNPLTEDDDMVRVEFSCHPTEPLKILEDWHKPPHCLICGQTS